MKLSIPQPDLLAAINRVRSVVESRNTIPILSFLKLNASGNELAITANDLVILATGKTPATVDAGGDVLIESSKLHDFVKRIPADRAIVIEAGGNSASIKAGRSRAKLATLPVGDFPPARDEIDGATFALTTDDVKRVLFGPLPAASDEETRYYLNGVHMHTKDDQLIGVATDGHKLIKIAMDAPSGCTLPVGCIIPTKAITVLQKCLGEGDVEVEVGIKAIRFETPSFIIQSSLVDGTFPDYQRVIPTERESPVTVHRAEAIGVVDRVACLTDDGLRTLLFEHDESGIMVRTTKNAEAEADDIILAETDDEFPYVGFATKKITDLLRSMTGTMVVMYFNDTGAPHVFVDPERPQDIHLLMPVRC